MYTEKGVYDMAGSTSVQQVYDYVREKIISKELFPGNRIVEEDLARAMHTSRTTVRGAITRMSYDGLIDLVPNCGAFVAKPTFVDMNHVYAVRTVLEVEATRLAVHRITDAALVRMEQNFEEQLRLTQAYSMSKYEELNRSFHWEIIQAAENEYIEKFLHELFNKTAIFLTFYDQTGTNRESNRTHKNLLEALKRRDEAAAIEATKADIVCAAACITIT